MKHVFIIGSKGIPARYGGFETFVDQLTLRKQSEDVQYHVSCQSDEQGEFEHNGARCFNVKPPNVGSAKAIFYDLKSLAKCVEYIQKHQLKDTIVYILACRIGPFFSYYKKKLERLGSKVYVNPDGHEWKRSKWSKPVRMYWRYSERLMVKHADLLICDSIGIENYIRKDYAQYNPSTRYISYGADITKSQMKATDPVLTEWFMKHGIRSGSYYLVVGRFVPENNYETMIREFMRSKTDKSLVLIANVEKNSFYENLLSATGFDQDKRIKFVGTVYDQELLGKIREEAYGYLHGHEVGGTNPSLLEALASTRLNLLLDVVFNREVGEDGALYFSKKEGDLARVLEEVDRLSPQLIEQYRQKAENRIRSAYSWEQIVGQYETLFLQDARQQSSIRNTNPTAVTR